jgi:anti-sigma-K factor RskA
MTLRHEKVTEETQEVAALYALGALSQHEARAYERHLREVCPACAEELARHEGVVANLGLAAPASVPSLYVRELLLARVEREAPTIDPGAKKEDSEPAPRRPSFLQAYLPWAIAAACAVLAVLAWLSFRQLGQEVASQQEKLNSVQNEAETLRLRLEQERAPAQQLEQIRSILSSPGSRLIELVAQQPASSASATVLWDTQKNRWVVTASLPPPPAGKVYQLWFITPGANVKAGLLRTDPTGRSFTDIDVPSSVKRITATAITLEPESGSEQPTMPLLALGKVS